jgi:acetylornithine deacetylase/succinyl-diaminopimelate desuccinylase-like protein
MHFAKSLLAVGFAGMLGSTIAAEPRLAKEHQARARDIFRELIEIKTTHDAGTTLAAEALAHRLLAAGFSGDDLKILGPQKGKENLIARLHGTGAAKPILFIAHLDVVEAKPEDWTVNPFKLTEQDGYFYGRGATDIKEEAAELIENFIRLREENFKPAGDFILALTADEEAGGLDNGVDWLVKTHRPLIDAAFCVNTDGGGGEIKRGKYIALPVQTAEKVYLSFKLELTDKGGHSSIPTKANPIFRLAEALARLSKFQFPIHVNETIRGYFAAMAEMENGPLVADMKAVAADPSNWPAAERLAAGLPYYNALLRTTATATLISGGHAENALPQIATATVNCRILPEESPDEIEATLKRVLADDSIVLTRIEPAKPSPASPVNPRIFDAVKTVTKEMWPDAAVMPIMMTGATDGLYLRGAGIPVYGISGMFTDVEDPRAHGKDERIGVTDFYDGVEFMYRLIKLLGVNNP